MDNCNHIVMRTINKSFKKTAGQGTLSGKKYCCVVFERLYVLSNWLEDGKEIQHSKKGQFYKLQNASLVLWLKCHWS